MISNKLRELRLKKELTQKELAMKTGLSFGAIANYELGYREPNSKAMVILENFFNVSGAYLIGEDDEHLEEKAEIVKEESIHLTIDEITTLQMYILMSEKYREREKEACSCLAKEVNADGTPRYPHMASNAEFWDKTEITLQTVLAKLR